MGGINVRKVIAILLLIMLTLYLFYLIVSDGLLQRVVYAFFFIVCVALISSDFKILKLGVLNKLYLLIEAPEITQQKEESFEDLISFFRRNYFSKKYYQDTGNLQLKIVKKTADSRFCVDSRAVFENLRKGLKFNIILKKEAKVNESTLPYDSVPVGLAEVEHVAELSRFNVVDWKDIKEYTEEVRYLKKGNLSRIRAYMEVVLEEDFQESSLEDLERAYDWLGRIYSKRRRALR